MKIIMRTCIWSRLVLLTLGLMLGPSGFAQESETRPPPIESAVSEATSATPETIKPANEAPVSVATVASSNSKLVPVERDSGFDLYLNRKLLKSAVKSMDPVQLTDLALQFMQGERVLFRSHKSITAEEVLKLAVEVATEQHDEASLERLRQAIETHGSKELAAQVKTTRQLAKTSRAADPGLQVSVLEMTPETFAVYQATLRNIENLRLRGAEEQLKTLRQQLTKLEKLGAVERTTVEQRIDAALLSVAENDTATIQKLTRLDALHDGTGLHVGTESDSNSPPSEALSALSAESRGGGKYAAIAYSKSTRAHGYSFNQPSRANAEEVALDHCAGPDARVVIWTKNGYVSLALSPRGASGWARSTNKATAEAMALKYCPGGTIKRTVYSGR
jgi:hypothetical protein